MAYRTRINYTAQQKSEMWDHLLLISSMSSRIDVEPCPKSDT
jgi:hypothetical protein